MTKDDIQKLLDENRLVAVQEVFEAELFAFARAIEQRTLTKQKARWYQAGVEAERAACAKLCQDFLAMECADAIRARGE